MLVVTMKKKRKKDKTEAEEILELEKELTDSDSIDQFTQEDKEIISRYIG